MGVVVTASNRLYNTPFNERACSMDVTKLSDSERTKRIMNFTADEVVALISQKYNIPTDKARSIFNKSGTKKSLFKSRTELWGESTIYVFECFEEEMKNQQQTVQ